MAVQVSNATVNGYGLFVTLRNRTLFYNLDTKRFEDKDLTKPEKSHTLDKPFIEEQDGDWIMSAGQNTFRLHPVKGEEGVYEFAMTYSVDSPWHAWTGNKGDIYRVDNANKIYEMERKIDV